MIGKKTYFVYILSNKYGMLYTGVTSNLTRRLFEHQSDSSRGFTRKYKIHRLIYYESTDEVMSALSREKQIKSWSRRKKLNLIRSVNPEFKDLSKLLVLE
jgi:putative endonuclease